VSYGALGKDFYGYLAPASQRALVSGYSSIDGSNITLASITRTTFQSSGNSSFQSMQAQVFRRYRRGFAMSSAFTYGRAIDDGSDLFANPNSPNLPQDSLVRSERGPSDYDVRLRSSSYFIWDVPRPSKWKRLASVQLTAIYSLQSALPFTVNSVIDVNGDGNLTDRLNSAAGLLPQGTQDKRVKLTLPADFLSMLALGDDIGTPGSDGKMGRNSFRGWGINSLDMAASSTLYLNENRSMTVRLEAYNVANRTDFAIPVRTLEQPGFGSAVSTAVAPRALKVTLSVSF
jgi:hypothetical protein